jgi:hypothetical protein
MFDTLQALGVFRRSRGRAARFAYWSAALRWFVLVGRLYFVRRLLRKSTHAQTCRQHRYCQRKSHLVIDPLPGLLSYHRNNLGLYGLDARTLPSDPPPYFMLNPWLRESTRENRNNLNGLTQSRGLIELQSTFSVARRRQKLAHCRSRSAPFRSIQSTNPQNVT